MRHRLLALFLLAASPALATDPQLGAIRVEIAPNVRHAFVSAQAQSSNSSIVSRNEWNAAHTVPAALVLSVPTGLVWPAQPAALTEFCGASTSYRWRADLTNATSIRLTAQVISAGAASSALRLQYTTDTTGATGWDYLDGSAGPSVSIAASGVAVSSSVNLATAAKADVLLRLVGINGDGAGGTACYSAIKASAATLADSATSATTATTAATVVTNADLTGPITSVGNATTVADGELAALAGLASAADKLPYFTGSGAAALADFSSANRAGLAALSGTNTGNQTTITGNAGTATALAANGANCSAGSAALGVDASGAAEGCFAVQAQSAPLQALADLSYGANICTYYTGVGVAATMSCTSAGRSMIGAADAAAQTALLSAFTGDSGSGGLKGLVPAPAAGDAAANKFLRAGGDWAAVNTTITDNATPTLGCGTGGIVTSVSDVAQCNEGLTYVGGVLTSGASTSAGNAITTSRTSISGSSATSNFLNVTGTLPTTRSAETVGAMFSFTGSGSSGVPYAGVKIDLLAGGSAVPGALNFGLSVNNYSATQPHHEGSGAIIGTSTPAGFGDSNSTAFGVKGVISGGSSNRVAGVVGIANSGSSAVGIFGSAREYTPSPQYAIGVAAMIGGVAPAFSALPTMAISTAVLADNGSLTADLIQARDASAAIPTTAATSTWRIMNGAVPQIGTAVLTTATMAAETQANARGAMVHSSTWTNAQVVALGASTTGDIKALTIPAKHVVENAYLIITGQGASVTTLTVSCGRSGAAYDDYITDVDAKAAANTRYGAVLGERGTNLTGWDQPSYTATTDVYCHFEASGGNLSAVTGSTGRLILITTLIP